MCSTKPSSSNTIVEAVRSEGGAGPTGNHEGAAAGGRGEESRLVGRPGGKKEREIPAAGEEQTSVWKKRQFFRLGGKKLLNAIRYFQERRKEK